MTKRFTAQTGSNNTIKIFNLTTGALHRIITVDGSIITQPVISENDLTVTVQIGDKKMIKLYNVASGSLKKSISL
jgi:WD40 repeat protein